MCKAIFFEDVRVIQSLLKLVVLKVIRSNDCGQIFHQKVRTTACRVYRKLVIISCKPVEKKLFKFNLVAHLV